MAAMSEPVRYANDSFGHMTTELNGEWVQWVHYDALAARCRELENEVYSLESWTQDKAVLEREKQQLEQQLAEAQSTIEAHEQIEALRIIQLSEAQRQLARCTTPEHFMNKLRDSEAARAQAEEKYEAGR